MACLRTEGWKSASVRTVSCETPGSDVGGSIVTLRFFLMSAGWPASCFIGRAYGSKYRYPHSRKPRHGPHSRSGNVARKDGFTHRDRGVSTRDRGKYVSINKI